MARIRGDNHAFGWPGLEPRWTHGDKDGIGTAYSAASRIWFTVWNGIVTEVYYPTVDMPQMRDVQLLFTDGQSFFHQETQYLESCIQRMPSCLGYRVVGRDPEGRYAYVKEIIADPHLPCLLQRVTVQANPEWLSRLKTYVLCAPHLDVGGSENNAFVVQSCGRELLMAEKNGTWLALMCSTPFSRLSVGYVGASDGWTDLSQGFQFDWQFDQALNGNVALTGKLELAAAQEFVVAIAFGNSQQRAIATLFQSLAQPFESQRTRFVEQWERTHKSHDALEDQSGDGGHLFHASYTLLLAHEDKAFQGAMVASLAIPWGQAKGDLEGEGGYHLVWTRDLVQCAGGLLAAGNVETPLRSLIYLATSQSDDGGFAQNSWVDGTPFWSGIQLDEVAFPILLAHKLWRSDGLREFDPYPMVLKAAAYLVRQGPVAPQARRKRFIGKRSGQIRKQIGGCPVHNAVTADAGLLPHGLNDMALAHAAPAHHRQIGPAADKIAGGQFLDLHAVEGFRIELPVESFERFILREPGFPDAACHGTFTARIGLCAQQQIEELQVSKTLLLSFGEGFVHRRGLQRNPQRGEVAQTPVTQLGCRHLLHRGSPFPPAAADTRLWSARRENSPGASR
jgi:hypothetical protein